MKVAPEQPEAMGRRVLVFSSIGHALMHMMTAFYAVIVLTLAVAWELPPERLLELYAPSAILLGVISLPAGWASDRFGAQCIVVAIDAKRRNQCHDNEQAGVGEQSGYMCGTPHIFCPFARAETEVAAKT